MLSRAKPTGPIIVVFAKETKTMWMKNFCREMKLPIAWTSERGLDKWGSQRKLPRILAGRRVFLDVLDLDAFYESLKQPAWA